MTTAEIAQAWAGVIFDLASPTIAGFFVAWLRKRHVNNTIIAALTRAAGMVILDMRRADKPSGFADALARGGRYMVERVPGYLRKNGITPEATVDMVYAEVGRQLGPEEAAKLLPAKTAPTVEPAHA